MKSSPFCLGFPAGKHLQLVSIFQLACSLAMAHWLPLESNPDVMNKVRAGAFESVDGWAPAG